MGNKFCRQLPPSPSTGTILTADEVLAIVKRDLRIGEDKVFVGDGEYYAYARTSLEAFLAVDPTNSFKYRAEAFDCDDFARVLEGREREWFRGNDKGNRGSTLGTVWGDIRPTETDLEIYAHAKNFFIDSNRELWLVEPQSDILTKPTANSTFWLACV